MTSYVDIHGSNHKRPSGEPVRWRIGGYGVIERDGLLLLVEPILASEWKWNLPGGGVHLDPEESIIEDTAREVFEETGYRFTPEPKTLAFLGDAFFRTPKGRYLRSVTFTVRGQVADLPEAAWVLPRGRDRLGRLG